LCERSLGKGRNAKCQSQVSRPFMPYLSGSNRGVVWTMTMTIKPQNLKKNNNNNKKHNEPFTLNPSRMATYRLYAVSTMAASITFRTRTGYTHQRGRHPNNSYAFVEQYRKSYSMRMPPRLAQADMVYVILGTIIDWLSLLIGQRCESQVSFRSTPQSSTFTANTQNTIEPAYGDVLRL
jgi:hypothetical protein